MRDPNRPEKVPNLNPKKRYLDKNEVYDGLADPGYRCTGRRPRVNGFDEIVSPERADRIEDIMADMPDMMDDY